MDVMPTTRQICGAPWMNPTSVLNIDRQQEASAGVEIDPHIEGLRYAAPPLFRSHQASRAAKNGVSSFSCTSKTRCAGLQQSLLVQPLPCSTETPSATEPLNSA